MGENQSRLEPPNRSVPSSSTYPKTKTIASTHAIHVTCNSSRNILCWFVKPSLTPQCLGHSQTSMLSLCMITPCIITNRAPPLGPGPRDRRRVITRGRDLQTHDRVDKYLANDASRVAGSI